MKNNKLNLNKYLIVVEGKSDVDFLKTIIDSDFFITNGSDINDEKINYLCCAERKGKKIVVLTDPDYPGEKIRKIINEKIPTSINIFLPKEKCIKNKKLGVAESDKDTVIESLKNLDSFNMNKKPSLIEINDVINLKLTGCQNSKVLREKICNKFNIGFCNTKTMLKRLSIIGVSVKELCEVMEKEFNDN